MEFFLKPFLEKGLVHSLQKLPAEGSSDSDVVKFLQRIIFKHDVLIDLKETLRSACASKPFAVKNGVVKNLVIHLNGLLLSDVNCKAKIDVFRYLFLSFAGTVKGDDSISVLQFFVVLCHILGIESPQLKSDGFPDIINRDNFNKAFEVEVSKASLTSFLVFKELLVSLSTLSANLYLSEAQVYHKWLQTLVRNFAQPQGFKIIFMEIFTVCADIDLKLVEGNLEQIFPTLLAQPPSQDFIQSYRHFFSEVFKICAKFQRPVKFVSRFLSSVKSTPTILSREVILPLDFMEEFSKAVKMASTQQSVMLFEVLVQIVDEFCSAVSENKPGFELGFLVTSTLLNDFLKEVKLFAPSVSSSSLGTLVDKLNLLKQVLKRFAEFVSGDVEFIKMNDNIIAEFLELCFYCGEVELLINCYKDSVALPEEVSEERPDWQCCLTGDQWNLLVKTVTKSKLGNCGLACFQLALQRLRRSKLEMESSLVEESTLKIILSLLKSNSGRLSLITPEDMTLLMESLTVKQSRSVVKKLFEEILVNAGEDDVTRWLSNPALQENSTFVLGLFAELLKESGVILTEAAGDKQGTREKFAWLLAEYFDEENNVREESLQALPEKLNCLLETGKKIRKSLSNLQGDPVESLMRVLGRLPLAHMREEVRRLGLSFSLGVAVASWNELALEMVHSFLASETDASTCFDVGLAIRWLSELSFERKEAHDLKMKLIEGLVRNSPNSKFGLIQMRGAIENEDAFKVKGGTPVRMLETQVVLHQELGKCWQRAKKRKSDNDLIGSYRTKLAKMLSEQAKALDVGGIDPGNSKLLLKVLTIELNNALKTGSEAELSSLMEGKFLPYFDFAVKQLKMGFDEASSSFLTLVLGLLPQLRQFTPENTFAEIWGALKSHGKGNWRLFCVHSDQEEFRMVLDDLLLMSQEFLDPQSETSGSCLDIWAAFFDVSSDSKLCECQLRLQDLFERINDCSLLLGDLPARRKISLIKFMGFCLSSQKVILTLSMLDITVHVLIECLDKCPPGAEDFHDLFVAEVDVASSVLLREFDWTKNKVHLAFVLFKRLLGSLAQRCDSGRQLTNEEVLVLSACGLSLEKWTSQMCAKEKDFARTTAYFVTDVISCVASVTVVPAVKIHLINSVNNFLSISDSHTVSYLLRVLKPGYQQVFGSVYGQFTKYHKYTGKI